MKHKWRHVSYRVCWFEHGSAVATHKNVPTLDAAIDMRAKLLGRGVGSVGIYREQVLA